MTDVEAESAPVAVDTEIQGGKKHVIWPVVSLARALIHPTTHFEDGAEEELHEHRAVGGSLLLLMTHFRRWEPIVMAELAGAHEPLRHLRYTTGITARHELFELPFPVGYIIRNSGARAVKRVIENQNETPAERAARQEANQQTQAIGGRCLAAGYNWLIFPEGTSRQTVERNGQQVREKRQLGVALPLRNGFVYSLESMTEEERQRVKLLAIAVHYGEERFSSLRPTVHISRLVAPVSGTREEMRQQGEDLLHRGVAQAVRLHDLRA